MQPQVWGAQAVAQPEGAGGCIAEARAAAEAAQPQIQAILGRMAPMMTSMPEVKAGEVVWEL